VIPCTGAKYVEEGILAANFAARNLPEVKEIILATDQPGSAFSGLPDRAIVKTCPHRVTCPRDFEAIWQSRIIKIQAPLLARYDVVMLMDSDMNLLRDFRVRILPGAILGSFRKGKMVSKLKNFGGEIPEMKDTRRVYYKTHLNSAFLVAHRETWAKLIEQWLKLYESIWNTIPSGPPPTDQLPLCIALDRLGLKTVDLGPWVNWPVSKKIGGRPGRIPSEVIGAHGGFPLEEWEIYLKDPGAELSFHGQDYTRKERYKG
ncbi:MAG: hypothetical protein WCH43_09780, partial [Verrucomicrobiota bacterium]